MSFNAFRENKILTKISEFTVLPYFMFKCVHKCIDAYMVAMPVVSKQMENSFVCFL